MTVVVTDVVATAAVVPLLLVPVALPLPPPPQALRVATAILIMPREKWLIRCFMVGLLWVVVGLRETVENRESFPIIQRIGLWAKNFCIKKGKYPLKYR
jgi:hypothetical protein